MASEATISRFMSRIKYQPAAFEYAFATMHRTLRSQVWIAVGPRNSASRPTRLDPLIIDIVVSLVHMHSDKEHVAVTHKRGYGVAPLIARTEYGKENGTGEILAVQLRPGHKGANSAKDHITILDQAVTPAAGRVPYEGRLLLCEKFMIRADSAGASRDFLHHLHSLRLQFSTSYALPVTNERFTGWIND